MGSARVRRQWLRVVAWSALAGALAAALVLLWQAAGPLPAHPRQFAAVSFADAVRRAAPAVVNVYTSKRIEARRHPLADDPLFRRFFQDRKRRSRVQRSLGSGVIVDSDGLILTNRHVIDEADEIVVLLQDGRNALASVVGSDSHTDLAVLRVALPGMRAIGQGNPDRLQVGDVVLAIGNPYGFGHSVSQGIVSALGRWGLNLSTYEDYIQTDAAVNVGNSGGALIDTRGKLVGINAAMYSRTGASVGIGLAIPSDLALLVMRDLVQYGRVIRGWMGLEAQPLPGPGNRQRLAVTATAPDSPAREAGIRVGDVITRIDGRQIVDGRSAIQQVALSRPGDVVRVTVLRGARRLELRVVVGQRPP